MTRLDIWRRYSEYNPHMDTRAANLKPNTGTVYLFTNCHLKLSSFNSVARADYQYSICMLRQARQGRAKETPRIELPVFSAQPTSRNRGRPILDYPYPYPILSRLLNGRTGSRYQHHPHNSQRGTVNWNTSKRTRGDVFVQGKAGIGSQQEINVLL